MTAIPDALVRLFDDTSDLDALFGRLMEIYGRAISADRCLLFLYEPARKLARCTHEWDREPGYAFGRSYAGWEPFDAQATAKDDPMFAEALHNPEALYIDDIEKADPALVNAPYEIENFQHRGLVHAPLIESGVLWGILEPCVIAAPKSWTPEDREVTAFVQRQLTPLAIRYVRDNCPA